MIQLFEPSATYILIHLRPHHYSLPLVTPGTTFEQGSVVLSIAARLQVVYRDSSNCPQTARYTCFLLHVMGVTFCWPHFQYSGHFFNSPGAVAHSFADGDRYTPCVQLHVCHLAVRLYPGVTKMQDLPFPDRCALFFVNVCTEQAPTGPLCIGLPQITSTYIVCE